MSGTSFPGPHSDRDAVAAEYVLGTLTAHEALLVEQALGGDPALREAVAAWEQRLAPLTVLAPPEAPPAGLWGQIERRVASISAGPARVQTRVTWRERLLGGWAIGATAAVAALVAFVLQNDPRETAPSMMTVLLSDRTQPAWTAAVERDGSLRLASVPPVSGSPDTTAFTGRVLQLWALPPGATAPTSLAVLPPEQKSIVVPAPPVTPVPGMLIEISLEPPGGSLTGRPTGPVLFIGRLSRPGPGT